MFCLQCNIIFLPCGHVCACWKCEAGLTHCPLCRAPIAQKVRLNQRIFQWGKLIMCSSLSTLFHDHVIFINDARQIEMIINNNNPLLNVRPSRSKKIMKCQTIICCLRVKKRKTSFLFPPFQKSKFRAFIFCQKGRRVIIIYNQFHTQIHVFTLLCILYYIM